MQVTGGHEQVSRLIVDQHYVVQHWKSRFKLAFDKDLGTVQYEGSICQAHIFGASRGPHILGPRSLHASRWHWNARQPANVVSSTITPRELRLLVMEATV